LLDRGTVSRFDTFQRLRARGHRRQYNGSYEPGSMYRSHVSQASSG